jgi:hypothetical protein
LAENLIHEGDLFGVVSTGLSSIEIDVTDDRRLLDEAAARIMGGGFNPNELIENFPPAAEGVPELRVRAQLAFNTMRDIIRSLETVQHLRKVVVYLSSGYDFNPFISERAGYHASGRAVTNPFSRLRGLYGGRGMAPSDPLSDDALTSEIAELAAAANRANASFYTVDPRGLVAGPEAAHYRLSGNRSFNAWIFKTQSLRLAGRGEKIHENVCRYRGLVPIREVWRARRATAAIRRVLDLGGTRGTCGASNAWSETRRS